jgi:hypothetical protein
MTDRHKAQPSFGLVDTSYEQAGDKDLPLPNHRSVNRRHRQSVAQEHDSYMLLIITLANGFLPCRYLRAMIRLFFLA